jgi:hypothetical protein
MENTNKLTSILDAMIDRQLTRKRRHFIILLFFLRKILYNEILKATIRSLDHFNVATANQSQKIVQELDCSLHLSFGCRFVASNYASSSSIQVHFS